jgi:hypothetical protein
MDAIKINQEAGLLLSHLGLRNLKTEEKVAALKSTAVMLETIMVIESTMEMMARTFNPTGNKTIN